MDDLLKFNLLHLFTFYLTVAFVLSTFRRLRQYRDIVHLVMTMSGRWPREFFSRSRSTGSCS